jgi:hypothetical protein
VPLPAHSHIIDSSLPESQANGGLAGWREIEVIGVTQPAIWDQIVAGKSLATVRVGGLSAIARPTRWAGPSRSALGVLLALFTTWLLVGLRSTTRAGSAPASTRASGPRAFRSARRSPDPHGDSFTATREARSLGLVRVSRIRRPGLTIVRRTRSRARQFAPARAALQGRLNATNVPPDGAPFLPPPAAMTTYSFPFTT